MNQSLAAQRPELSLREIQGYREWIADLAAEALLPEGDLQYCDPELWSYFDYTTVIGSQVYRSYSDQELLALLQQAQQRLGYCPRKRDLYCVYQRYIRYRFGSWPTALAAAGLAAETTLPPEQLQQLLLGLDQDQQYAICQLLTAAELSKHPLMKPLVKQAQEVLLPRFEYKQAIHQAVAWWQECDLSSDAELAVAESPELAALRSLAADLGRTPLRAEMDFANVFVLWQAYQGWGRVLAAAGLEPLSAEQLLQARREFALRRASVEFVDPYTLRSVGAKGQAALQELCRLAQQLGRSPFREEIPAAMFRQLNQQFGSWRLALSKLGLEPPDKKQNRRFAKRVNRSRKAHGDHK